jgi:hypothetical protein
MLAELLQDIELLVALEYKALENERGLGPRAIELGDVNAKRQFVDGDFP